MQIFFSIFLLIVIARLMTKEQWCAQTLQGAKNNINMLHF